MATNYTPSATDDHQVGTITIPAPGDDGTAESVNVPFRALAGRMRTALENVSLAGVTMVRKLLVNTSAAGATAIAGQAATSGVGVSGNGGVGVAGTSVTTGGAAMSANAAGDGVTGLNASASGTSAYAVVANGNANANALFARGFIDFGVAGGLATMLNVSPSTPILNRIVPKNVVKAWGHVGNGTLLDGVNVFGVTKQSLDVARVSFASPMQTPYYAAFVIGCNNPGLSNTVTVKATHFNDPSYPPAPAHFHVHSFTQRVSFSSTPVAGSAFNVDNLAYDIDLTEYVFVVLGEQEMSL